MLQVTDAAVSVFKEFLASTEGGAIRIEPVQGPGGETGITFTAVTQGRTGDAGAEATDLDVFVAPELASSLDDAILDARSTDRGPELFLRAQARRA